MKARSAILRTWLLLAAAFAVPGHAQNPIELDWTVGPTRRTTLVITPVQLKVSRVAQGNVVDLSSLGAGDTATAATLLGALFNQTQREFFSAPLNTDGVLTVETSVAGPGGSVVTGAVEVPYEVDQGGAQMGAPRESPEHPGGDASVFALSTAGTSLAAGYSGELGLRIMAMAQNLAETGEAEVRFKALGAVTVLSDESLVRTLALADGTPEPENVGFAIPMGERGIIDAEVSVPGPDGQAAFRSTRLYFLAGQRRVQIGAGGFESLEIAELDDRRASGAIDAQEYEILLAELLGQDTEQTVTPDDQTP